MDRALYNAVKDLAADDLISDDSAEYGIGMQAAFSGFDALTPNQQQVFRNRLLPLLRQHDPYTDFTDDL